MTLVELSADLIESALFVFFLNRYHGKKTKQKKLYIESFIAFIFLFGNILLSDCMQLFSAVTSVIDFLIVMVYAKRCLQGNRLEHINGFLLFYIGLMETSIASIRFITFAKSEGIFLWMNIDSWERMLLVSFSKGMLLLYVAVILAIRKRVSIVYSKAMHIAMCLISALVTVLFIVLMELLFEFYYLDKRGVVVISILFVIMILMAVILYLVMLIGRKNYVEKEKEYALDMVHAQKISYQNLVKQNERIQTIEHDMKNMLLGIKNIVLTGDVEKSVGKIDVILKDLCECSKVQGRRYAWEMVIDHKLAFARQYGIEIEKRIDENDYDDIEELDLCIILGNLLDNAIEAEEGQDEKKIALWMTKEKGYIFIKIKNRVKELEDIQLEETSKPDRCKHGLGIKSVQQLVHKYQGRLDYKRTEQNLEVRLLLKCR